MKKTQTGDLLLQAREGLGLSREELAESLDVATTTVFRWEKGLQGPSFDHMVGAAEILKKPLSYFSGLADEDVQVQEDPFETVSRVISKFAKLSGKNRDLLLKSLNQMLLAQESHLNKKKVN